jgi:hypothetical protein
MRDFDRQKLVINLANQRGFPLRGQGEADDDFDGA